MKVLITASSGVGKSTIITELAKRGFTAIDGDEEPGLARLEIKETGQPVPWPQGYVDWHYYSWNLQEAVLKEALERDDLVFLGGIYGNQAAFYPLFDKLIALTITPEEHQRRLYTKPKRAAGDDAKNIHARLTKYQTIMQRFIDSGATLIDASGDVVATVDAILQEVGHES